MNEMIEQLAEIADRYADGYLQSKGEYHPDWHTVRDNKFAKLIVLECAVIVGSMEESHQDIATVIKEHFGIE